MQLEASYMNLALLCVGHGRTAVEYVSLIRVFHQTTSIRFLFHFGHLEYQPQRILEVLFMHIVSFSNLMTVLAEFADVEISILRSRANSIGC